MTHPLALARRAANLSQSGLAKIVNISRTSIARIETQRQVPSLELVALIKSALRGRGVELSADVFVPETRMVYQRENSRKRRSRAREGVR